MRNVSNAYKQMLYYDQRNYICTLNITLADGTKLTVNNDNIMDGGIEVDDAISEDGDFTALGSTVIRGCTVTLYNNNEMYSNYEFKDAKVIVKINLRGADASDEIQLGEFTVDEPTYSDFSITLSLLDNMYQFDRGYASYNIYTSSTTLFDIVVDACTKCGVLYDSSMTNFPNRNFVVPQAPKDKTTYREVLGWCATLAGCFARITDDGKLIFQWFNTDAFDADDESSVDGGVFDSASPYATGDDVNGGTFNPWNDPASKDGGTFTERNGIHYITALNTQNIGVDDVVVTGIRVTYDIEEENSVESVTRLRGTDDYVIDIDDNPFITNDNYVAVLDFLQPILIGLQFRTCNVTHPNDPTIQAGDVGYIWDSKGAQHRILITRATFNPTNLQTIVCSAKSPVRNSSARLSTTSKALAKSTRRLNEEKALREQLEEDFARKIADSAGLYWTKVNNSGGGYTVYAHDKKLLADSSTVLKINSGAIATTGDYTGDDSTTQWFGFEFDGVWLANIISTIGIDFDWGVGGKLTIQDKNGNETFFADADTGIVRIKATEFSLTDGTTLASVQSSAISSAKSYTDTQLGNYKDTVDAVVANLQSQIDGQVMTWYYDYEPTMNNKPASDWTTTALRQQHEGDVFYWKTKGYAYRFMKSGSTWGWTLIQDTDITTAIAKAENAQNTADHKRRVFVAQPVPPYDIGDLWTQGSSGDLYRCENARASGSYVAGDWKKATKYTDDSTFTSFRDGTYAAFVTNTNSAISGKITTYYQTSAPSSANKGDLWIDTYNGNKLHRYSGSAWVAVQDSAIQTAITAAGDAQATADSKIITFAQASQPTATDVGDLWIDTNDANKMYRWNGSQWVQYTDSSAVDALEIGGRNLVLATDEAIILIATTAASSGEFIDNLLFSSYATEQAKTDTVVTVSFNYTVANNTLTNGGVTPWIGNSRSRSAGNFKTERYGTGSNISKRYVCTAKLTSLQIPAQKFWIYFKASEGAILTVTNIKVEFGDKATTWDPAPEDVDNAIQAVDTALDQEEIFNRLTNNGQAQGIYMQNGKLYLNFDYAVGQTLKLGGNNNVNGLLKIYNSSGVEVGQINNDGLQIKSADGVYEGRLDSGGFDLYYNNVYTGTFASGYSESDVNSRVIATHLGEHSTDNGIAWGAWSEEQQINIVKFYYAKVANLFPNTENEEDTLNADCDLDMHNYKIKNTRMVDPKWRLDDISTNGSSTYLYVKGATSGYRTALIFRHGILVGYSAESDDTSPV